MAKALSGKHILLLLLYSPGVETDKNEPVEGRTRIIKMMFLFDREISKNFFKDADFECKSFPEFVPWNYGPFSKELYNDIEFFINNEFIETHSLSSELTEVELDEFENWMEDYLFEDEKELIFNIQNEECFQLSQQGIKFVEDKIYNELSTEQKNLLIELKKRINSASLTSILRYVYLKYPECTKKSKIKNRVIR